MLKFREAGLLNFWHGMEHFKHVQIKVGKQTVKLESQEPKAITLTFKMIHIFFIAGYNLLIICLPALVVEIGVINCIRNICRFIIWLCKRFVLVCIGFCKKISKLGALLKFLIIYRKMF